MASPLTDDLFPSRGSFLWSRRRKILPHHLGLLNQIQSHVFYKALQIPSLKPQRASNAEAVAQWLGKTPYKAGTYVGT